MAEPDSGVVNLSFMHSLGVYLVPELLKEFRKIYPKIQFRLSQNHSFLLSKTIIQRRVRFMPLQFSDKF